MLRFGTINSQEIDKYVNSKKALIIDVRDKKDYDRKHIENAINIPFEKLEKTYNKMPSDLTLVLYCQHGGTSLLAAKELFDLGYTVRALIGGIGSYRGKYLVKG